MKEITSLGVHLLQVLIFLFMTLVIAIMYYYLVIAIMYYCDVILEMLALLYWNSLHGATSLSYIIGKQSQTITIINNHYPSQTNIDTNNHHELAKVH